MRVLHVIPSVSDRSGGPAQAIFPMCRALEAKGIETLLVTTDAGIDIDTPLSKDPIKMKNVSTLFFPSQWGKSFKFSRPMSVWLDENVREFDLVHIHAVFNHACIAAARACRKHGVPYVVRPLGTLDPWGMSQKRLMKSAFWALTGQRMLRGASAVHYTTRAEREAAEDSLKISRGSVVPLGIDLDIAESPIGEELISVRPPSEPYVLVLSRLHPKKGLDVLLDAFFEVTKDKRFEDWRLVLAGDGPEDYVRLLKRKSESVGTASVVSFPGWLEGETKKLFLQRASVLALPSHRENFGLCVLEALTCGVPVVISENVNLAETIEAAGAGWVGTLGRESLVQILSEAMGSDVERAKRGEAGRQLSRRFTWSEVASELVDLYRLVNAQREVEIV
jgi:glycosyltransferase involved in cell wall biosynthesis